MKNLKSVLGRNLVWKFSKKIITLTSDDEIVVELKQEKTYRASFELGRHNFIIRNIGFWNPKTIIEREGKQVLVLKRKFLGSKGYIEFENGNQYSCKTRNSPLVKLSFFDKGEKEILSYKLDASLKPKTILNIADHSVDENELLMLIILGCYSFQGIVIENDTSDMIVMASA